MGEKSQRRTAVSSGGTEAPKRTQQERQGHKNLNVLDAKW